MQLVLQSVQMLLMLRKLLVIDLAADNNAGDVTVTINSGFTSASLEIDGSQLDANVTTAN